jgi:hypothetical protein
VLLDGPSALRVDQPPQFAATVDLLDDEIDLMVLATADSYTSQNDLLSIFGGGKLLDALKLTD